MMEEYQHRFDNIVIASGHIITMTDAGILQANKNCSIPLLSILSSAATISTIVPGLNISSLLSLGKLCEEGFNVLFNKHKMYTIKRQVSGDIRGAESSQWLVVFFYHHIPKN